MSDSFAGVSTFVVLDGSAEEQAPLVVSKRQIPGSNTWYYDIAGQGPVVRKLLLRFGNDADYAAFRALRGTVDTLVCFDYSGLAILEDVHRTFRNPPGSSTEAEATFTLL